MMGGDFNVHNEMFEPAVDNSQRGEEVANWATTADMADIGEPGVATQETGHVLDLNIFEHSVYTHSYTCRSG